MKSHAMRAAAFLAAAVSAALPAFPGTVASMADTFLEADASQAIDTGYKANGKTTVVVDFACSNTNGTRYVFGSVAESYTYSLGLYFQAGKYISFGMGDAKAGSQTISPYSNFGTAGPMTFSRYTATLDSGNGVATIKGFGKTVTKTVTIPRTGEADYTMSIFARHISSGYDSLFAGRIYSMQIYDDGALVRDYIPYGYGAVTGLLDRVTGTVAQNVRSGGHAFKIGTDPGYARGGESSKLFVDTGFVPNGNTKVEVDFSMMTVTEKARVFGVTASGGLCIDFRVDDKGESFYYNFCDKNANNGKTIPVKIDGERRVFAIDGKTSTATLRRYVEEENEFEGTINTSHALAALKSILVFGASSGSDPLRPADVKIHGFKIWDDGTLVRSYTPRMIDGVVGLWDSVNGKFATHMWPSTIGLSGGGELESASLSGAGDAANLDAYLEAPAAGPVLDTGIEIAGDTRIVLDCAFNITNNLTRYFFDARSSVAGYGLGRTAKLPKSPCATGMRAALTRIPRSRTASTTPGRPSMSISRTKPRPSSATTRPSTQARTSRSITRRAAA